MLHMLVHRTLVINQVIKLQNRLKGRKWDMDKKLKISIIVGTCALLCVGIAWFMLGGKSSNKQAPGELNVVDSSASATTVEPQKDVKTTSNVVTNTNSETQTTSAPSIKEKASEYLNKFGGNLHEGLSEERIAEITKWKHDEEKMNEKSTLVVSQHPQNEKDDEKFTEFTVIAKNLQATSESDSNEVKDGILEKLHKAASDLTKVAKTSASAYDVDGIANDYFYRVHTGVMSFVLWLGNDWTMDDGSLKVYQYTIAWKKGDKVMGYMMGTYYKTPKSTELVSFSMTQLGSEDNYNQRERGKIK